MGKWIHRLDNINPVNRTALCSECGVVAIRKKGDGYWRCLNSPGAKMAGKHIYWSSGKRPQRQLPSMVCEKCGFVAEYSCQLDVHHLDSDRKNNSRENLSIICANCHRLITHTHGHYIPKKYSAVKQKGPQTQ